MVTNPNPGWIDVVKQQLIINQQLQQANRHAAKLAFHKPRTSWGYAANITTLSKHNQRLLQNEEELLIILALLQGTEQELFK